MSLHIRRPAVSLAAVALATVSLAACGSSSSGSSTSASSSSTPTATGRPGGAGRGPGGIDIAAIQKCLKAAGISIPTGLPGGASGRPSGAPSGIPSGAPSGIPSGAPGGRGGLLNDPKVQAALKACGISMPTGAPTNS